MLPYVIPSSPARHRLELAHGCLIRLILLTALVLNTMCHVVKFSFADAAILDVGDAA